MSQIPQTQNLRKIATLMDSQFSIAGIRFGLDPLLGLLPGIGDLLTAAVSIYILAQAAFLGATPSVLIRMGWNILVDNLLDAVPVLGQIFDFAWRSNNKNVDLLEAYLQNPQRTSNLSFATLAGIVILLALSLVAAITLMILFFTWILGQFDAAFIGTT